MKKKYIIALTASVLTYSVINAFTSFVAFESLSFVTNDTISVMCDTTRCVDDSVRKGSSSVTEKIDSVCEDSVTCDTLKSSEDSVKQVNIRRYGLSVSFKIMDFLSHEALDTAYAHLLLAKDSSEVSELWFAKSSGGDRVESFVLAYIETPGDYLIRVRSDNYRTEYVPFNLKKIRKKETSRYLNTLYMHRLPREREVDLDEIVVKASKLKFYMDGDTLVYDADAFNMAEGSMLDGLIRRLPGVTLSRDGEIAVNGERVEELLLNGKNFFNSDRNLMLENLPSYMVKDVQVYERAPEEVRGTKREQEVEKQLVMNIKLKKEYNGGWIANVEGGLGTPYEKNINGKHDAKYLGRFFALHFNDKMRFSAYANLNNLNDYRDPGREDGEWTPLKQSEGLTTSYKVGMNGLYNFSEETRYEGNVNYHYSDTYNEIISNGTNSYSDDRNGVEMMRYSGDFSRIQSYRHEVESRHSFSTRRKSAFFGLLKNLGFSFYPRISYSNFKRSGSGALVQFTDDVISRLGKSWLDSISAPDACDLLKKYAIDRNRSNNCYDGHGVSSNGYGYLYANPMYNDYISFSGNFDYHIYNYKYNSYSHDKYDYPQSGQPSVFQNRFTPRYDLNFNSTASFTVHFSLGKGHSVGVENEVEYKRNESDNYVYMLQKLDDWNDEEKHELGTLPSMEDRLIALDSYNSSTKSEFTTTYTPLVSYSYSKYNVKTNGSSQFAISLSMQVEHKGMEFWQGSQADVSLRRNNIFFRPSLSFNRSNYKKGFDFSANFRMSSSSPSLYYLVDVENTTNPQYRSKNNPHLKNENEYRFSTSYRNRFNRTLFNVRGDMTVITNSVGNSRLVNASNGFVLDSVVNVNGNWDAGFSGGVDLPLCSGDKWRLKNDLNYHFRNSVDYSGVYGAEAVESTVKNHNSSNELNLVFRPSHILEVTALGKINWQHSSSARTDFTTINTFTYNYGLLAQVELPLNMQFATDITMFSRRGYSNMNSDELVWNARLSKRLMKGNLVIQLDGFDILGNLSNVRVYFNGRGREEQMYNVIPSYCLLHGIWRLNKQPKKK